MSDRLDLELRKFVAPELVFGPGARMQAAKYAANFGCRKILLVSDPGVLAAGWTQEMMQQLTEAGLDFVLFSELTQNPKDHEVMAGWEFFSANRCDSILAIGGGSVVDCAKGIGVVAGNGGNILDYIGVDTIAQPCPPLICVPTTAGAAADVSQFAIITDTRQRCKVAIISKAIVPDVSLIDPDVLRTLPPFLVACTGMDALTHAVEAYVSNAGSALTDLHALKAVELVGRYLLPAVANAGAASARQQMALACLEAGLAFSNASLGAVHAMAHSLGGYLDLPHGECNALLLEHVINFNFPAAKQRYEQLALTLDVPQSPGHSLQERLVDHVTELRERAGIGGTLSSRGVGHSELNELVAHAVVDPCLVTNPRSAKSEDIKTIYQEAL